MLNLAMITIPNGLKKDILGSIFPGAVGNCLSFVGIITILSGPLGVRYVQLNLKKYVYSVFSPQNSLSNKNEGR